MTDHVQVGRAYLLHLYELWHKHVVGDEEIVDYLFSTIDPEDLLSTWRGLDPSNRVATTDGANAAATQAAPPLGSITSAGGASLRSCDPAQHSVKVPCD